MHHVYDLFLRLLPEDFRRRYGVEMALDFADGWREAATGGWRRRVEFAMRASGDLAMTLFREWTRGARLGVVAATASVTALLWGLALRPWSWPWQTSPSPRHAAVVPVTEAELLVLAGTAMLPVLVLLLFARRLVQRQDCGRRVFRRLAIRVTSTPRPTPTMERRPHTNRLSVP